MHQSRNGYEYYTATLDYPIGVNATYAGRGGGLRKTAKAKAWYEKAVKDLRDQGFRPLPNDMYWCAIRYELTTVRLDVDAPAKSIIDAISEALSTVTYETKTIEQLKLSKSKVTGKSKKVLVKSKRTIKKMDGFNDRWVGLVEEHKVRCSSYVKQGLKVQVIVARVGGAAEFNQIGQRLRNQNTVYRLAEEGKLF